MRRYILTSILILALIAGNLAFAQEKPIVVVTTNVLGSIIKEVAEDKVSVIVLAQPGICPADYDMKPSDIYAVSKAKLLFYHGIKGEFWLKKLLNIANNKELKMVKIAGNWNTPKGAKKYIKWIAGNLSKELGVDFSIKANELIKEIDDAAKEIKEEASRLNVKDVKVIVMAWQAPFVSWIGFKVVEKYGPPEMLPAGTAAKIAEKAKSENVLLIIDNLQSGIDFGANIASEVNAKHVVLTNFPGAIPGTESLAKMMKYNAKQLFDKLKLAKETQKLEKEVNELKNQMFMYQSVIAILAAITVIEGIWLYVGKKKK